MANDSDRSSLSGLTECGSEGIPRAVRKELHRLHVIAIIAHILVWNWRPWIPDPRDTRCWIARIAPARPADLRELRRDRQCTRYGYCSIRAALSSRSFAFLFVLALLIHFIVLSTDRFNWLEGQPSKTGQIEQDDPGGGAVVLRLTREGELRETAADGRQTRARGHEARLHRHVGDGRHGDAEF